MPQGLTNVSLQIGVQRKRWGRTVGPSEALGKHTLGFGKLCIPGGNVNGHLPQPIKREGLRDSFWTRAAQSGFAGSAWLVTRRSAGREAP